MNRGLGHLVDSLHNDKVMTAYMVLLVVMTGNSFWVLNIIISEFFIIKRSMGNFLFYL